MAVSGVTCMLITVCSLTFNFSFVSSYCYKNWTLNIDGIDEDKINVSFGSHYIADRGISLSWTWKTDKPSSTWWCRFWYSPLTNKTSGGFMYRNKFERIKTYLVWRNMSGCVKWNSRGNRYIEQPAWSISTCEGHTWGFTPGNFKDGTQSYFYIGDLNMTQPWGKSEDGVIQSDDTNSTRYRRQTETFPEAPQQPTKPKTFGEWMKQIFNKMFGRNGRGETFMTRAANWFVSLFRRNSTSTNTISRSYPGQGKGFDVPESDPDAEVIPTGEGRNDVESLTERSVPKSRYPPKRLY